METILSRVGEGLSNLPYAWLILFHLQYPDIALDMPQQEKPEIRTPVSDEHYPNPIFEEQQPSQVLEPFIVLAKHRNLIVWTVVTAALVSGVISFLLAKAYTANARILPPQESTSIAGAMLGQLGPLISSAAGKDMGLHNPNDIYVAMLHSRTISDRIIDRFSLMSVYGKKLRVDARHKLDSEVEITVGRDNVISISVEDRDPQRATDMANAYVEELGKLTRTLAVTEAAKRRLFFEQEMKTASDELASAEDALKKTEENTGIIQLDNQAKGMLQAYEEMRARVSAKEVEIEGMKSFATKDNPDLVRAEQELAALRSQLGRFEKGTRNGSTSEPSDVALSRVPGAGLEYVRKLRVVKYRETLLELLTKQYEIARIDESKEAALIQVLDNAVVPEKKSWPPRTALVTVSTLIAFIVVLPLVFLIEWGKKAMQDPHFTAHWDLLKFYLRGQHRRAK
jgi:tyrosine-protein kinase Etk/Wzc